MKKTVPVVSEEKIELYRQMLEQRWRCFDAERFVSADPVQVVHAMAERGADVADVELCALMTCMIAWGNRKMIVRNATKLMERASWRPKQWLLSGGFEAYDDSECVHRTLNYAGLKSVLRQIAPVYERYGSLKAWMEAHDLTTKELLTQLCEWTTAARMGSPERGSACKRLNMMVRWMVRKDGVDLGLWHTEKINSGTLYAIMDTHVAQQANKMGLISYPKESWKAVEELTARFRSWDSADPLRFDMVIMEVNLEQSL